MQGARSQGYPVDTPRFADVASGPISIRKRQMSFRARLLTKIAAAVIKNAAPESMVDYTIGGCVRNLTHVAVIPSQNPACRFARAWVHRQPYEACVWISEVLVSLLLDDLYLNPSRFKLADWDKSLLMAGGSHQVHSGPAAFVTG